MNPLNETETTSITAARKPLPGMKVLRNVNEKGTQSSSTMQASYGGKSYTFAVPASGPWSALG
ncbi:MAG TPA: hypothetical protein V6D22_19310 [Candidatus Obscuribacterales bacterium]